MHRRLDTTLQALRQDLNLQLDQEAVDRACRQVGHRWRLVMGEAARRQGVEAERISFVDALRWLLEARSGDELPELVVNPERPGRFEPRVKKRRPKQFDLMRKPRAELREKLNKEEVPA